LGKYLATYSTTKIEEILIEADSYDDAYYQLSAGVGQVINQYNVSSGVESMEEVDA